MTRLSRPWFGLCFLLLGSCGDGSNPGEGQAEASNAGDPAAPTSNAAALEDPEEVALFEHASRVLERVLATPALPGAPGFEARRAELVARAKGEPVVFVETPGGATLDGANDAELGKLLASTHTWAAVQGVLARHAGNYTRLRELLLRDGYLYSENPGMAFALLSQVGPQHLFDEGQIWIQRGEHLMHAERRGARYVYVDGPHEGENATLIHLDRVGTGPLPRPLHRDLRSLKYRLHFDEVRVDRVTETHLVLALRYGEDWVATVARSDGARLELEAELIEPGQRPRIDTARARNAAHQASLQSLREAIAAQVSERLPFDEPKTEVGQEDGRLRGLWQSAYLLGLQEYAYNEDTYRVFSPGGAPLVPQVCIDFVVDTFERASGTWWSDASGPRERRVGGIEWRESFEANLRRNDAFVGFAAEHQEWFDVLELPAREQIRMGDASRFFGAMAVRAQDFQAGDIVLIRGYTPWDEEEQHSHAFMIYETDPITGMPILIAGNAGSANLWSWETEARRTPLRTMRYRIRPKAPWLHGALQAPRARDEAPLLLRRENAATVPAPGALVAGKTRTPSGQTGSSEPTNPA